MIAFVMNSCYLVLCSEVATKKAHASLQDCPSPGLTSCSHAFNLST